MRDNKILPQAGLDRLIIGLTWLVAVLVAAIGAIALYISYDALYQTGLENGYSGTRAWLWPLLVDAPLVVFTVAVLVAQLLRQKITLWAGLVIAYTLATIGFNLAHAQSSLLGWGVAMAAPLGLLLTTEALRHLAKVQIERYATMASLSQMVQQLATQRQEASTLERQIQQASDKLTQLKNNINEEISRKNQNSVADLNASRDAKMMKRVNKTYQMLQEGFSKSDIASQLAVTPRTVERYITMLNGKAETQ